MRTVTARLATADRLATDITIGPHLLRADELLFFRLATCHNLTFVLDFMASIRAALAEGRFADLVRAQAALRDNSAQEGLSA